MLFVLSISVCVFVSLFALPLSALCELFSALLFVLSASFVCYVSAFRFVILLSDRLLCSVCNCFMCLRV